ncbi:MAG TPA: hypothetical protein VF209_05185 [Patescibacteria group bacterium]
MSHKEKRQPKVDLEETQPVEVGARQLLASLKFRWQTYKWILPPNDFEAFMLRVSDYEAQAVSLERRQLNSEKLEAALLAEHQHLEKLVRTIRQNHAAATKRRHLESISKTKELPVLDLLEGERYSPTEEDMISFAESYQANPLVNKRRDPEEEFWDSSMHDELFGDDGGYGL